VHFTAFTVSAVSRTGSCCVVSLLFVGADISTAKLLGHSCPSAAVCADWRGAVLEAQQSGVSVQQDVLGIRCTGMLMDTAHAPSEFCFHSLAYTFVN